MSKHKKSKPPQKAPKAQISRKIPMEANPEFQQMLEKQYGSTMDLSDMPEEMKLSAKMIDMVEPFTDEGLPVSVLYDCATIAWNACLKEDFDVKADYVLNNMLMDFTRNSDLIDALKERKRLLFPREMRRVKKVGIYDTGDGRLNINVASDWDAMTALRATLERLSE